MKGQCLKCKSFNLEYGDSILETLEGESLGYEFQCENCGSEGVEWYDLEYSETIMEYNKREA